MEQARHRRQGAIRSYPSGEPLEPRRLLAGIEAGVLVARGAATNDRITVARGSGDTIIVTTNATTQTFNLNAFTGIRLVGQGGNDLLSIGGEIPQPVTLDGGAGNDRMESGAGAAHVIAGEGSDTWAYRGTATAIDIRSNLDLERLDVQSATVTSVTGNDISNTIRIESGRSVTVRGMGGDDGIIGGSGHDRLEGGDGNDFLAGDSGNDTLVGGNGDDRLDGGSGDDLADGGPGRNTHQDIERFAGGGKPAIVVQNRLLLVTGTALNDTITMQRDGADDVIVRVNALVRRIDMDDFQNVRVRGFQGDDVIRQLHPLDDHTTFHVVHLEGDEGNDTMSGIFVRGGAGNDRLAGLTPDAQLLGEDGDDFLDALNGAPGGHLVGGAGRDTARIDGGDNLVDSIESIAPGSFSRPSIGGDGFLQAYGTNGDDTITIERTGADNVIIRVNGVSREFDLDGVEDIQLEGLGGNDTIIVRHRIAAGSRVPRLFARGGTGNDTMTGAGGAEWFLGDAGNDRLVGGAGLDSLEGGDGDDFFDSFDGAGGDTVLGGAGRDNARVDVGDSVDVDGTIVNS